MAGRLFAKLLALYPRGFRAEYGSTVLDMLEARAAEARRRGRLAHGRFVVREAVGLVRAALRERRAERRRAGRSVAGQDGSAGPGPRGGGPTPWTAVVALRPALRQFRHHPLYALACAGTLAVAVAAGATCLAVVRLAFLDPLPWANDRELLMLFTSSETWDQGPVSAHVVEDLAASGGPFAALASLDGTRLAYRGPEATLQVDAVQVTGAYLDLLGVRPALGGVWPEGERHAVMVTWDFWQRELGGDPDVVGGSVVLDETPHTVTGVMPEGFRHPLWSRAELLVPLDVAALLELPGRGVRTLSVLLRRTPDATTEQVAAHLELFSDRLRSAYPGDHARERWTAAPLRTFLIGDSRPALLGTAAAAVLLLLIVGANVAGLSAVRAVALRPQVALREALGATRRRLLTQRVVDGAVLALAGAAAGLALAWGLVAALARFQASFLNGLPPLTLDATTALAAAAAGLLLGVAATVLPQSLLGPGTGRGLGGARVTGGRGVTALRSALVVAQVALALVLVAGAGLLVQTVRHLATTPLGFRSEGLVTMRVSMPPARYGESELQVRFERDVLERLERVPGVSSASASVGVPVIGGGRAVVRVADRTDDAAMGEIAFMSVSPEFTTSLGMTMRAGRGFGPDDAPEAPGVAVINEAMARRFWPGGDELGARLHMGAGPEGEPNITVIGVVQDFRQHGPTEPVLPTAFTSTRQYSWPERYFTVRAEGAPPTLAADMRAAVAAVDPGAPVGGVTTVDDLVAERTARYELVMMALGLFGSAAAALAALGLYTVVGLSSRQRRREWAIRMAVGAPLGRVRWLVLRQGLVLGGAGTLVGLALAAAGTRILEGLLHGVAALDAPTFALAALGILALAVAAGWAPARAAGRVDPAETLNAE